MEFFDLDSIADALRAQPLIYYPPFKPMGLPRVEFFDGFGFWWSERSERPLFEAAVYFGA